jgi:hypothetical protein
MSMKPVLSVAVLGVAVACGGSVDVPVVDPPIQGVCVTSVIVNPSSATLLQGDSLRLTAGACFIAPSAWTWTSSNPSVVSVARETGVVHALSAGTVTITARAIADTNVRGAAIISVSTGASDLLITIKSVSYVSNGRPVNLDSLAGVIQVDASASTLSAGSQTAELVISRGSNDTVVAIATSPAPVPQNYTHSLRWNTDARDAAGSRVFGNGVVLFRVRFRESTSSTVANSTIQQGTLKNP